MSTKFGGYTGCIVKVDLSTKEISEYPWTDEQRELFIGGKIAAAKIIGDNVGAEVDPLSPENMLAVVTGPFTGCGAPSSARFDISTKSPLTGYLTSSNCGGSFGFHLKKAGYDALLITGKAKKPTWLEIDDGEIKFHDAKDLWGKKTSETQVALDEKLKSKTGKIVIGPAGENLVLYASITSNERFAGRGGVGCVMGSKNLKAVTAKGTHKMEVKQPEKFKKLTKKWIKYLKSHPLCGDQLPRLGTAGLMSIMQENGQLATKNYKYGQFEDVDKVSGETLARDHNITNKGCLTCPIKCARTVKVDGKEVKGPELETLGLLSAGILNNDIEAVFKWNYEIDELGMDTISAANTLSYAMEANEQGLWDTGLDFGKIDNISKTFEDIAYRRGIGDELANGSKWCAEKHGGTEFAANAKGMELSAYEPRRSVGLGLGYAISNRGGCHLNGGYLILVEGLSLHVNPQTPKAKADFTQVFQNMMEFVSSCGQCLFTTYGFLPPILLKKPNAWYTRALCGIVPHIGWALRFMNKFPGALAINLPVVFNQSKALKYITGMKVNFGKCMKIGKRGYNLERHINTKYGVDASKDTIQSRLTDENQIEGDNTTKVPLEKLKAKYYKGRGWDQNGIPKDKLLRKLKIKED
ncbi:MAG: aldehyde ferredoxin oxidoreductase family protein [Coriobacteriia bacterium]|nr:aldehyde ferredoxin oxidoreductase family protein [Coriobacteriia bacterium]